jgi:hypothetical protein
MKNQILAQSGGARRAAAHPSAVQRAAGESAFAAANIRNSPRMVAQRRQQQSLFGNLAPSAGRVRPTMQMQGGGYVNDDKALEHEADAMGARAAARARISPDAVPQEPRLDGSPLPKRNLGQSKGTASARFSAPKQFVLGSATAVVQKESRELRYAGTPQQLSITYTDTFERDLINSSVDDFAHAFLALSDDFKDAPGVADFTDAKLSANRDYSFPFPVRSQTFEYWCRWDNQAKRLLVQKARYIGTGTPPDFMVPSAQLRQKAHEASAIRPEDLPSIDWLYVNMHWNIAEVKATSSSGGVITFIPPGGSVVQYYKDTERFKKTVAQLEKLANRGIAGVAEARPLADPGLRLLEVEKVDALNQLPDEGADSPRKKYVAENAQRIFIETRQAILDMADRGMSQGDISIDNLGLRGKTKGYALFDFNAAESATQATMERDLRKLIASIEYHGTKVPDEYKKNPQSKGPWG